MRCLTDIKVPNRSYFFLDKHYSCSLAFYYKKTIKFVILQEIKGQDEGVVYILNAVPFFLSCFKFFPLYDILQQSAYRLY